MRTTPLLPLVALFALIGHLTVSSSTLNATPNPKVLWDFSNTGSGGYLPWAGLIMDANGNLYGTNAFAIGQNCPDNGCGNVFELVPNGDGTWTEKVLYTFCSLQNCADGIQPVASLTFGPQGNLYGTTGGGGTGTGCQKGCGTVFELVPNDDGTWTEKVLYSFNDNGSDAYGPESPVVFDAEDNLYGTTPFGGNYGCEYMGCGAVYELSPGADGAWTETVIHRFSRKKSASGMYPYGGVILDASGNLYGETDGGGVYDNQGMVYELVRRENGWTEKVLHSFGKGEDGRGGAAGLTFDSNGNLYGTTVSGGAHKGAGVVFRLKSTGNGKWQEELLHSFVYKTDGGELFNAVILDGSGNVYGVAASGGLYNGGTVFEISRSGKEGWSEKTLLNLDFNGPYGSDPLGGVIIDASGNLYGTANQGGTSGYGTVFEVTP
jgi:uncharacterized repeat protein (TIGR03803 family)